MNHDCYNCDYLQTRLAAGAQLVDVRSPLEFTGGSLPGAINLPLESVGVAGESRDPRRSGLVYCVSGKRSEQARQVLVALGFDDVLNIGGYEHYRHCH